MNYLKPILLSVLFITVVTTTFISGCKKEKVETCTDGIKNQNETGVDCGGVCAACTSCSDGIQNQNETGVDCGGVCTPCASCSDGIQNQNETGVDCGGVCAACACPTGFEGTNCDVEIRAKFIGTYSGPEVCTGSTDNYILTITAAGSILNVTLSNIYGSSIEAIGTADGTTLTIPLQSVAAGITIVGSASLSGNTLTFNYTLAESGTTETCTYTGLKQ